ncbi:hypothetical protein RAS1_37990 [Phycisphaerae bacterium RAS1]|nr:hypothetical protein RAS1_37990 [Phycisphaerae bacterium RAS1]
MQAVLDLSPRQTTRVLEQAVRLRSTLQIEPRVWTGSESVWAILEQRDGRLLRAALREPVREWPLASLVGSACDVRMLLDGDMYIFSTHVVEASDATVPHRIALELPAGVVVANRRRFSRRAPRQPLEVRVWPAESELPLICQVQNLGSEGVACCGAAADLDEALFVGDRVRVAFEFAWSGETFELPATLCTKANQRGSDQQALGIEFAPDPGDGQQADLLLRLRTILNDDLENFVDLEGGA